MATTYDFDTPVDRYGTDCIKFDFAVERKHPIDTLSYWVADMDFRTAPEILDALRARIDHGIFGYTNIKPHYFEAVRLWMLRHYDYAVERRWLVETPGVVFALGTAIHAFTQPGEAIVVQTPVYYPFSSTIRASGRKVVPSPLVWESDGWHCDFDDFEKKIADSGARLFLLCNPHNPGGKSWRREELLRLGEICLRHGVTVVSDEIHADFTWGANRHTCFATLSDALADIAVVCTSPSKSFNLAGLQVSNIFIRNEKLRAAFRAARDATGYDEPHALGLVACEAAYAKGERWLREAKSYINENLNRAVAFLSRKADPRIRALKPEATYLLWIDLRAVGLPDAELNALLSEKAKLWLDAGTMFGEEGAGFVRMNAACPWSYLEQGLRRLDETIRGVQ